MKKYILVVIALISSMLSVAQDLVHTSYSWDQNPTYTIAEEDKDLDMVGLKDYRIVEYGFENENEFYQYNIIHKVLWLNSDDRIERFNRIYLPYRSDSELLRSQARVVSANGIVQELDDSKIFTATDETTNRTIKYYALEGIEKGGFIEYLYIIKKVAKYKGQYLRLQENYKIKDSKFELYSPENLVFKIYPINSDQEAAEDTGVEGKQHLIIQKYDLPELEAEDLSAVEAMKQAIIYKLDSNKATGASGFSSYSDIAKNVHNFVNAELDKGDLSKVKKFLKEAAIDPNGDDESKIRTLENHIKNSIYITNTGGDQLSDIGFVIENKAADETGAIRLFANSLKELGIPFEVVLTCDRTEMKFDPEIEALNFLQDYLIYFPTTKQYIAPGKQENRYGFPPFEYTDTYGLFVKEVKLGKLSSGVGKVKYIESPDAAASVDEMTYKVTFDPEDLTEVSIDFDHAIGGYNASFIHPFMNLVNDENKEEFYEEFIKRMGDELTIESKEIFNEAPENFGINPLRIKATLSSSAFTDKAGPKYLFKLGELIGPQIEMYQEKKRQLPVENTFRKTYLRTIEITIPEGYTINNLDDINIDNRYEKDGKDLMNFISSYTKEGNKIIITANEMYDQNILPVALYEEYRTVINSAADFNKVTLILEPTK
ncbi:DUF3857 domain-containing protein [Dokdonia pacifica]|uniref:DUF3857 domain-containing protein n=1 Tax=Dokdonia pacifica TaxID=1627892 RepID=A0A238W9H1_9FLAO|nr:DUF3857 domain-containing protein [Dokdonia pacifica]SNR43057.1 protein of unknown function [Dokdonia pacifica]